MTISIYNLTAERIDRTSFNISWDDINEHTTSHDLRWKKASAHDLEYTQVNDVNTPYLVDNLDTGCNYIIEVLGKSDEGILWCEFVIVSTE